MLVNHLLLFNISVPLDIASGEALVVAAQTSMALVSPKLGTSIM